MRSLLFLLLLGGSLTAQLSPIFDSVPTADNRKLACSIYLPSGWTSGPVIVIQTPYNRLAYQVIGLPLGVGMNLNNSNYAFVIVDWRGFYGSQAAYYLNCPARGNDGYDVIEWVNTRAWCNGKIGTWGPSALGRVQFMTAKKNPPSLDCMVPLVAGPQYSYLEYFPGGSIRTEYVEQLDGLGFGMSATLLANPVYNILWQVSEMTNFYPDSIRIPTFMIGGWYDHTIDVMIDFFNGIRSNSPANVQNQHRLLMGPWVHGGYGPAQVGSPNQGQLSYPNAAWWNDSLALLFYDYHLRAIPNNWNSTPFIQYYQMGSNVWNSSTTWPPTGMNNINLYFHPGGGLDNISPVSATGDASFLYDPTDPSPTIGGTTLRADLDQGPFDQVPLVESRSDILTFTTAPLGADVILKGKPQVRMKVSSDRLDTDFSVRLTDVYPDGRSMLIHDGIFRMRFRNGYMAADTAVMNPGTIYDILVDLPHTAITFLAGHKIRVDITSSNYPRFNRNMNTGGAMYPGPSLDTLVNPLIASNSIYMNSTDYSYITLPLVDFNGGSAENVIAPLFIFPNPASDYLIVSSCSQKGTVQIMDGTGRIVLEQLCAAAGDVRIDLTGLPAGIYSVRTTWGQTEKLIVIR
ncbi:MAG: CocE/NonD family hydrolase [Bacteroidia bacterium]|nr:CocE/NonD family hydrolase [Bacteroidia bacterium]